MSSPPVSTVEAIVASTSDAPVATVSANSVRSREKSSPPLTSSIDTSSESDSRDSCSQSCLLDDDSDSGAVEVDEVSDAPRSVSNEVKAVDSGEDGEVAIRNLQIPIP